MDFLLVGPPGSGKGTQAGELARLLGAPHISTGDLFRSHVERGTRLGEEAKGYVSQGRLVPDELTVRMVEDRLREADAKRGSILDGFPRTVPQAEALDRTLAGLGRRVDRVIVIDVPEAELLSRLSGRRLCRAGAHSYHARFNAPQVAGRCDVDGSELYQREDDTEEKVRRRLADYREKTGPVIEHYRRRPGVVVDVDGVGSIEEIQRRLAAAIGPSDGRREPAR
jgi:adenylate kinase